MAFDLVGLLEGALALLLDADALVPLQQQLGQGLLEGVLRLGEASLERADGLVGPGRLLLAALGRRLNVLQVDEALRLALGPAGLGLARPLHLGRDAGPGLLDGRLKEASLLPLVLERARLDKADWGIEEMSKSCDTVVIVDNNRLVQFVPNLPMNQAFAVADTLVAKAVKGLSDTIMLPSLVNIDFADVRAIMHNAGSALMGIGTAIGEHRAEMAARAAINSPLLEVSIHGAKGVLFSIAGGEDLGMLEVQDAANVITEAIDPDAKVIFGAVTDGSLKKGQVRVTVIATGFPEAGARSSLFAGSQRLVAKKDQDVPPVNPRAREEMKKILETPEKHDKAAAKDVLKSEISKTPLKTEDDDDGWGGLPSFLRRK